MTTEPHIRDTEKTVEPHPDDLAVDKFAAAMKEKLALARRKGRSGWENIHPDELSAMLYHHLEKGDPRDVANFCMFLWHKCERIHPCEKNKEELEAQISKSNAEAEQIRRALNAVMAGLKPFTELRDAPAVIKALESEVARLREALDDTLTLAAITGGVSMQSNTFKAIFAKGFAALAANKEGAL